MSTVASFVKGLVTPPPRPPLLIPWVARSYGAQINAALDRAWEACYLQGLLNGFIAGLLAGTMFYVLLGKPYPTDRRR